MQFEDFINSNVPFFLSTDKIMNYTPDGRSGERVGVDFFLNRNRPR